MVNCCAGLGGLHRHTSTVTNPRAADGTADASRVLTRSTVVGVCSLVIAIAVVLHGRVGADWPAQDFRAFLAHRGLSVWDNAWYDGHPLPGYSVLYPLLASFASSSVIAVASVTVSAALAAVLAPPMGRAWGGAYLIAVLVCLVECLVIGQVTFLLGVAFGLVALVGLATSPPRSSSGGWANATLVAVAAALSSLASPLAGLFLLIAGAGRVRSLGWRRVVPLVGALSGSVVAEVIGGGGGSYPFAAKAIEAITICCVALAVLVDHRDRWLRDLALTYLVVSVVLFCFANPVGGNLTRLGKLVALPLAIAYLASRRMPAWRRLAVVVAAGLALWWSLIPFVVAVHRGVGDPARSAGYYRGLLGYLHSQNPLDGRLEIPFTQTHWESYWVARDFPLARGWERQTDQHDNAVLYRHLDAATYRRWLDDNAVSLVALPRVPLDFGGVAEQHLLQQGIPRYLVPVWHDRNWQVWRVVAPHPIADGAARLTEMGPASLTLRFTSAGSSVVRVHTSPLWQVSSGHAALRRTSADWLEVTTNHAGTVTLRARLGSAILDPGNPLRG
jgi:hypothetical protein